MNNLFGRKKIYTAATAITRENVIEELNNVLPSHFKNKGEEDYLYWYRRGKQPILDKVKTVREEINNKITQNVASEIVAFKNGYFLTKPTFYVSRKDDETMAESVNELNDYLYLSHKADTDNGVVDWFHTVGVGVLYMEATGDSDVPVMTYAVDPRNAFVVYSKRPSGEPMMGVNMVTVDGDGLTSKVIFDVWTKDRIFHIEGGTSITNVDNTTIGCAASKIVSEEPNNIGDIPLIEYVYDRNRMGAFETVLPLLDAINDAQSNRLDSEEQFVNSLLIFYNCQLGDDEEGSPITPKKIREMGAIYLKSVGQDRADVKEISSVLDQSQTQVLVDDLLKQVCDIAGMPFTTDTKGGTSDNNGAVYLRSGWASADCFARNTEDLFKESNKRFDKIFMNILRYATNLDMKASDVDIQFSRNELENVLVKSQSAINLKQLGLSPELILEKTGLSNDPAGDVARSKEYIEMAFSASATPAVETDRQFENGEDDGETGNKES